MALFSAAFGAQQFQGVLRKQSTALDLGSNTPRKLSERERNQARKIHERKSSPLKQALANSSSRTACVQRAKGQQKTPAGPKVQKPQHVRAKSQTVEQAEAPASSTSSGVQRADPYEREIRERKLRSRMPNAELAESFRQRRSSSSSVADLLGLGMNDAPRQTAFLARSAISGKYDVHPSARSDSQPAGVCSSR